MHLLGMGVSARAVEQADAADEPHGGWKDSKVACLHLKSASQLIRGVRPTVNRARRATMASSFGCTTTSRNGRCCAMNAESSLNDARSANDRTATALRCTATAIHGTNLWLRQRRGPLS